MIGKSATLLGLGAAVCLSAAAAQANVQVQITVENLATSQGVALSPLFVGAHNGGFDQFDAAAMASTGVENVAELGATTDVINELLAAQSTAASGVIEHATNGVFFPGTSGSVVLDLDPTLHRYFSYGAMVVPSNDYFIGNDSPTQVELFDALGNFTAADFTLVGSNIWDSGTEVNQLFGSAFIVGQDATVGTDENGVVTLGADLSLFQGQDTPAGYVFNDLPTGSTPVARISFSVVPEPASAGLLLGGAVGGLMRRRKVG